MRLFGFNIELEQTRLQRESMVFEAGRDAGLKDLKFLDARNSEDEIESLQAKVANWEKKYCQDVATLTESLGYGYGRPTNLSEAHRQFHNINEHATIDRNKKQNLKQTAQHLLDSVYAMAPVLKAKADGKDLKEKVLIAKARGCNHYNVIRVQDVKDLLATAHDLQKELG